MQPIIDSYTKIILAQSALLLESTTSRLNEAQKSAISLIDTYTRQLEQALNNAQALSEADVRHFVRHELLNILTPIVGYAEMLADGWIGKLEPDQAAHVEIILHAVRDLMGFIRSIKPQALAS